ncbi:MAG TPA: hypothetical protein VN915_09550 [Elusimicrobiota bacterium]|nr:hypothetical protein [Elusimicrobiota bacterium]
MNRKWMLIAAAALLGFAALPGARAAEMSEKEKALASPYPNDLGPDSLPDDVVKSYPENVQKGYHILKGEVQKDGKWVYNNGKSGCVQCHTASRPLNSRFLEPEGGMDEAAQTANLAKLKKDQPELFKDLTVWQPEVKVFNRYVKRMMNKPGCSITKLEGKSIWEFLEYDGAHRKTGENAAKWAEHRKKLVAEFKEKYPKRYEELKAANDL